MTLTNSDWILIVQAFILLITCGVLIWYTWETSRIRKETSIQNTYLAEQLRIMDANYRNQLQQEASLLKPLFRFQGGNSSPVVASYQFINKGGPARKLNLIYTAKCTMSINPTRLLESQETGTIQIRSESLPQMGKVPFQIECLDKAGNKHVFRYSFTPQRGILEEEDFE